MQTAAPSILIQRTDNDNNASIDFIGQAGATGAQIQFSGSSNELTFGTYDGSSVIERLRIEDGTTPNIIITGSTNISGSATSTASFGTYIGDGNGLTNISSTSLNGISLGLSTVVGDGASSATSYGNAFGKSATSTGGQNVAVGAFSNVKAGGVSIGQSTSGGNYTVAIGRDVGNTNGEYNVLIGDRAGSNSSGDYNIWLGYL